MQKHDCIKSHHQLTAICVMLPGTQVKRKVHSVAVQCNLLVDQSCVPHCDSVVRESATLSDSESSDDVTDTDYLPNEDEESDEEEHCVRRQSVHHSSGVAGLVKFKKSSMCCILIVCSTP